MIATYTFDVFSRAGTGVWIGNGCGGCAGSRPR